jgi:phosphoribosyl-ATP pyrophosphohydrolase/phosphoribosyl-AMP cyclohydrolase
MDRDTMQAVKFGADGLLPAIAQDAVTGDVLMVAYMNADALRRTVETGEAWYWSRSRARLWRKGEESGHTQRVRDVRVDCDGDALLLVVDQTGPACHTGRPSCFYRDIDGHEHAGLPAAETLGGLFALIQDRAAQMPDGSYTARLIRGGPEAIAGKVREESDELIRAAREESDRRVVEEAADLLYHTMVLLAGRGVALDDVRRELERRRR